MQWNHIHFLYTFSFRKLTKSAPLESNLLRLTTPLRQQVHLLLHTTVSHTQLALIHWGDSSQAWGGVCFRSVYCFRIDSTSPDSVRKLCPQPKRRIAVGYKSRGDENFAIFLRALFLIVAPPLCRDQYWRRAPSVGHDALHDRSVQELHVTNRHVTKNRLVLVYVQRDKGLTAGSTEYCYFDVRTVHLLIVHYPDQQMHNTDVYIYIYIYI